MRTILILIMFIYPLAVSPCHAQWTSQYYPNDFDGDKKSDLCVWRPSTGEWFCVPSSGQVIPGWTPVGAGPGSVIQWGLPGDKLVPGDYDGDFKTDAAVLRPGTMNWYVRYSSGGSAVVQLGLNGDYPITGPGFTTAGDDFTVFRSTSSSSGSLFCRTAGGSIVSWGVSGSFYVHGNHGSFPYFWANSAHWYTKYNGNAIRRTFISCNTGFGNYVDYPLSNSGHFTTAAYLAGDVQYDYAHFLNNVWTIYPGGQGLVTPTVVTWGWGLTNDVPVKGDFDGDRRADLAVYNNGSWRVYSSGYFYGSPPPHMLPYSSNPGDYWFQWGQAGDIPIE